MQSFNEFINSDKPILFLNFSHDVEEHDGSTINIKKFLTNEIRNSVFFDYTDIKFQFGELFVNDLKISDCSFVFFGAIHENMEFAVSVENFCKNSKIATMFYGSTPETNRKMLQYTKLASNDINIPKSIISVASKLKIEDLTKNIKFPIVSKQTGASKGVSVEINKDLASLKNSIKSLGDNVSIFQEFIDNDTDYRLLFIDDELIYCLKRSSIFLPNGKKEKASFCKLPNDVIEYAKKIHKITGFYISGVDLIFDENSKKWNCLEVNPAPGFKLVEKTLKLIVNKIKNHAKF